MPSWCSGKNTKVQHTEECFVGDEETPSTVASTSENETDNQRSDFMNDDEPESPANESDNTPQERVLTAGPPPAAPIAKTASPTQPTPTPPPVSTQPEAAKDDASTSPDCKPFTREETLFIFDWDDTVLPSSWVQGQGLRLDRSSVPTAAQRAQLAEVATAAAQTLRAAKRHGTVVLVTNAERGWIELSCQKFLPTLYPLLENVKLVSARTTYEGPGCTSPLDWKLRAFSVGITRHYTPEALQDKNRRKNAFSLGDSVHEREALLTALSSVPNCRSKSLKFVERPDISQLCKQHELIVGSFQQMVHHDGHLDLCIRCP